MSASQSSSARSHSSALTVRITLDKRELAVRTKKTATFERLALSVKESFGLTPSIRLVFFYKDESYFDTNKTTLETAGATQNTRIAAERLPWGKLKKSKTSSRGAGASGASASSASH